MSVGGRWIVIVTFVAFASLGFEKFIVKLNCVPIGMLSFIGVPFIVGVALIMNDGFAFIQNDTLDDTSVPCVMFAYGVTVTVLLASPIDAFWLIFRVMFHINDSFGATFKLSIV